MTLTELSNIIETEVAAIPAIDPHVYLRATQNDANVSIDTLDLKGRAVFIFNNLPNLDHVLSKSGYTSQVIPVEIKVLKLGNIDDTTKQGDTLRDECLALAYQLFDLLGKYQELPDISEYQINTLGEANVYDKTLTGVSLNFVINGARAVYYAC